MGVNWFPFWLSLRVAALATLISLGVGLWLAYLLASRPFRGKPWLDAAVRLPLLLPPTVLAYYLLVLIGRASLFGHVYEWAFGYPLVFTWQAAVVASTLSAIPLLTGSARTAFEIVDQSHARTARSLGASEWRIFWRITLPMTRRSIAAATALAFARALGDFGVTLMIAGNLPGQTQTAAIAIYDAVQGGDGQAARALVLALSAVVLGLVYAANRLERPRVNG